jgi:hypothetical protein
MDKETSTPLKPSKWEGFLKKTRKIIRWFMILVILFIGLSVWFKYFYTYSEGYRAGLLQKFSNKGNIFKTNEGELILSSVSSTANVALASEKFFFSVPDKKLAARLDTLQGMNVIIHYRQTHGAVFWRGDSPYLVDSVKVRR